MLKAEEARAELLYVGKPLHRIDSFEKVTGRALYGYDLNAPWLLHGKIKRSPHPHAEIIRIDTSRAERLPGVRAVITAKDCPDALHGTGLNDTPTLARDRVRYVGEPVAAVAADSPEVAEEALELIEVEYRELPALFDPEEAIAPDPAVVLHPDLMSYKTAPTWKPIRDPRRPNVGNQVRVIKGDVEKGFREADLIVENRFTTQAAQHVHTEPVVSMVKVENDGSVTVWTSNQAPYRIRQELSDALQLPPSMIRVIIPYVGGGFGNKLSIHTEAIAAILSKKTGRPVKIALTREEVFSCTTIRHPFILYIKDGVMKDGRIIAREIKAILNGGAYSGGAGIAVTRNTIFSAISSYDIPNIRIHTMRAYTNQVPGGAFRGFGCAQMDWAIESQMDIVADRLGMDPLELRLKNLLKEGGYTAIGERLVGVHHEEALRRAAEVIGWRDRRRTKDGVWRRGKGIALTEKYSGEPAASAYVRVREDGFIEVWASATEIGQGSYTALTQIAAEEFGVPLERIRLVTPDTGLTPYDSGAISSRETFNVGNAVRLACQDAKMRIFEKAAKLLDAKPEDLDTEQGEVFVKHDRDRRVPITALFIRGKTRYGAFLEKGSDFWGAGTFFIPTGSLDPETGQCSTDRANAAYTSCAEAAEVAVNIETGQVKVLRFLVVADVGKAINPSLAIGQLEGAVSMGLGASLYEELVIDRGKPLNPDFKDYKVPGSLDSPKIDVILLEDPHQDGPYGAKPLGEAAILGVAPALANAIYDAVGVRIKDLPITAEKILKGLKEL